MFLSDIPEMTNMRPCLEEPEWTSHNSVLSFALEETETRLEEESNPESCASQGRSLCFSLVCRLVNCREGS